ncbi:MAG: N-methylproline demethylase, partial [Paracoccus sp. (in: a-proteobacteria)]
LAYPETTRWLKEFAKSRLRPEGSMRLSSVVRDGNRLCATLTNELTHETFDRVVDQVVVEMGTIPMNDLFDDLRQASGNDGVTDIHALRDLKPQPRPRKGFELHRIGDALSSRNIHAAIYDALRLCSVS